MAAKWTDGDEIYLIDNWGDRSAEDIAKSLNRSLNAVIRRASSLGIRSTRSPQNRCWTEEELLFLRQNWQIKSTKDIAKHLNRSKSAVSIRASILGLRRYEYSDKCKNYSPWTIQDEEFLRQNAHLMDLPSLAIALKRTCVSVRRKAQMLKVKVNGSLMPPRTYSPWSKEDDEFLIKNYQDFSCKEIAQRMDRSVSSIRTRARILGQSRYVRKTWTKEDERFLIDNYQRLSCSAIATKLGRSERAVKQKAITLNISMSVMKAKTPRSIKLIQANKRTELFSAIAPEIKNKSLRELNLSRGTYNSLRRAGLSTVSDVIDHERRSGLETIRNLGVTRIKEVEQAIGY